MLDDLWVWHIAGPDILCLSCAEGRLGRCFTPRDFKRVPANDCKRVVLAVCTGWMGFEMMGSCRKQRVLVGCR